MTGLRVLLVEDHPVFRLGLRGALETDDEISVAGEAGTLAEGKRLLIEQEYDVVVLDMSLPDGSGMELLEWLAAERRRECGVVMSVHGSPELVRSALKSGARGYLTKGASPQELHRAVRTVHDGGVYLAAEVAGAAVSDEPTPGSHLEATLTPREISVARLLSEGLTTAQAAARLTVSPKTIEAHRTSIYRKLGIRNVAQLTRLVAGAEYRVRDGGPLDPPH